MNEVNKYFPKDKLGNVLAFNKINTGLSGSSVYSVKTAEGDFILRIHRSQNTDWSALVRLQNLASDNGITPKVSYMNEDEKVIVTDRVEGKTLGEALRNPEDTTRIFSSIISNLKKLQSLPQENIQSVDALKFAKEHWSKQSKLSHFPKWALPLKDSLDALETILERDDRRVICHNDLNPGNILWDNTRAWLIDWEIGGLNHPYYDIATLATFLNLNSEVALSLLEAQENGALEVKQKEVFHAYHKLAAIIYGLIFLGMTDVVLEASFDETPTLAKCYDLMSRGGMSLDSSKGQSMIGQAMLKKAF